MAPIRFIKKKEPRHRILNTLEVSFYNILGKTMLVCMKEIESHVLSDIFQTWSTCPSMPFSDNPLLQLSSGILNIVLFF